ncbi:histidine kinase [Algoriphagus boseongensis]|uniref:Histidine kinase n=1 Tax=Algoriphagus boseongensis TaxID=1442587 RepID=A0A4R6TC27_9BACT|nr:histidine kinase [Algoriphagus boseongensis]TDQ19014.1 histidine kinase [Algoriphagus boseongensis]
MKSKSLDFRQIEWWVVTMAFLSIFLFNLFGFRPDSYISSSFQIFQFVARLIIPVVLYLSFHLVHMVLIPKYQLTKKPVPIVIYTVLITGASLFTSAIFGYQAELISSPFPTFYLGVVGIYASYLISSFVLEQALTPPKLKDFQVYNLVRLGFIYLFTILFLIQILPVSNNGPLITLGIIVPGLFFLGIYQYYLVYQNQLNGKTKSSRWFKWGLLGLILFGFFAASIDNNQEMVAVVGVGFVAFLALILQPLTSLIFKKYDSFVGKISVLTNQVDQGNASFDFLRSQINPHFLFNALNTLYASALIENADKTSDGIQKLGDMMRFMLHENQLPSIPLSREIDYLRNYLDLQMLRFGSQANLEVDIQINESQCIGEIAPMLIIPFVENAFKHGISAKEKSWIRLNLRCMAGSVHLDLVNSVHPEKPTSEKSREESGIGLENVKKRLELLYPNQHQLNIIANDSDFFVHLSVQLTHS